MTTQMDDEQCPGCGSDLADRERYRKQHGGDQSIPMGLSTCPHCSSKKCCMCNMGDDAECMSCNPDD